MERGGKERDLLTSMQFLEESNMDYMSVPSFLSSLPITGAFNFYTLIFSFAFAEACKLMMSVTCSIPDFTCISCAKVVLQYSIYSFCTTYLFSVDMQIFRNEVVFICCNKILHLN